MNIYEEKRNESKLEVTTYLHRLQYALKSGKAKINFQKNRIVDEKRDEKYTNKYTMLRLFPHEDEVEILKRELANLRSRDYIETVKDTRYPDRKDMRVFGKKYSNEDVYIKIRVELINVTGIGGDNYIFVMSFHFAEKAFAENDFPYRKNGGE
jgi:hypothetical protein